MTASQERVSVSDIRSPRVAIIGAGAAGIAMGVRLRKLGLGEFTIFEQSDGIGGVWYDNLYPGAEVDTPQPLYSFSFSPFDFTRTHPKQSEVLAYLKSTADRFQLQPQLRLGTAVTRAVWDDSSHSYEVFTSDGGRERYEVVVSAVGLLNRPNYPNWPGMEKFKGRKFHSAQWDPEVDLAGKRVAVVGTGSTSAQLVPAIAPVVSQLYVFQRQPGWLLPKGERNLTVEERARLLQPVYRRYMRLHQAALVYEKRVGYKVEGAKKNKQVQDACEKYIESVFEDRPDLKKMVTPDYPVGGKRLIKDSNFYPSLLRENVELVPHPVTAVTETEIIDATNFRREIDVLIMCTGFQPAKYLATLEIVGRHGRTIHEAWNGDPHAYLGLTVSGFPNFYMLYGPNTNGGATMFLLEHQTEFVVANLKQMARDNVTAIEVRKRVMDVFNVVLQKRLARTVMAQYPSVHNYGRSMSGRNVIAWDEGLTVYALLTKMTRRLSSFSRRPNS